MTCQSGAMDKRQDETRQERVQCPTHCFQPGFTQSLDIVFQSFSSDTTLKLNMSDSN